MALERPRFATTKLREGYATDAVDDAVDRILAALAEPAPSMAAADVGRLRFTPVRLAEGYDMGEVDGWLDRAAAELDRAAGGGAAPAAATAYETPAGDTRSAAVTEVRAGSSRALLVLVLLVVVAVVAYALYA